MRVAFVSGLVAILASPCAGGAQQMAIAGYVRAADGNPIAGARLHVVGTTARAQTGRSGEFRLTISPQDTARVCTLQIERIGFATRAVQVRLSDTLVHVDVSLDELPLRLDETIVTATAGTLSRRAQPGVVATVPVADLASVVPLATVPDALQGRVSSLDLTPSSGSSGEAQRMWLRGATSFSLSNEPLVVIDGVRADSRIQRLRPDVGGQASSRLFDVDPADIERIEVVKGPAAAAMYGADASTGVIQIFTRRGADAKAARQRFQVEGGLIDPNWTPPGNFARCEAADVEAGSAARLCHGREAGSVVSDNPLLRTGVLRDGRNIETHWSVDGGSETVGIYAGVGASSEAGTLPQNGFDRRALRVTSRWSVTPSFSIDAGFGFASTRTAHPQNGDNPTFGLLSAATSGSPLTVGSRSDGDLGAPLLALATVEQVLNVARATPTLELTQTVGERLYQRLTLGVDVSSSIGRFFVPLRDDSAFVGEGADGEVRQDHEMFQATTVDYLGTVRLFDDARRRIGMKLSAGAQYVQLSDQTLIAAASGLLSNYANQISNAADRTSSNLYTLTNSLGTYGQVELTWHERLYTQAGARADRNSTFGSRAGPQWFPKVGASWVLLDGARDRSPLRGLSTLRLRASFGTSGRAPPQTESGATYAAAPVIAAPGTIIEGLSPLSSGNPKLRSERSSEVEVGIDAALLKDQVALEITHFEKRSTDLLYRIAQPPSFGFTVDPLANLGARILNEGWEADARWAAALANHALEADLGFSTLRNVAPFQRSLPIGAMFDYRVLSIDTIVGRALVTDTAQYTGPSMPARSAFAGATVDLVRPVRLHVDLDGKWGYWQHNGDADVRDRVLGNSELAVYADRLSANERLRRFGPFFTRDGREIGESAVLGPYLQDASFVRWRTASVIVALPESILHVLGASRGEFMLAGQNLRLWTHYRGDPEEVSMISENPKGGTVQFAQPTLFTMPQPRRWTARASLTF